MISIKKLLILFLMYNTVQAYCQSAHVLPGTETDYIANRWDILYNFDHEVYGSIRNTSRVEMVKRALQLSTIDMDTSPHMRNEIQYIIDDNTEYLVNLPRQNSVQSEKIYDSTGVFYYLNADQNSKSVDNYSSEKKPFLKYFYKTRANAFEVNTENFKMRLNPILNLKYYGSIDDDNTIFQNTRGLEIKGTIDDNIYYYTNILENQAGFANFIDNRIAAFQTIPGQGLYKPYNSSVIGGLDGYDFLNAQAYVGINATKSVAIEFGHGRHFIGNGVRSLLMSDYAHNYFYLKFNTRVWKFQYQNIFAELAPISGNQNPSDRLLPKKYMASHYLSFKPFKTMELGLFETVMFNRTDHFEFQYLNPVILYRTVEQFLDSPDNVLIGLNGKWNLYQRIQLYGQVILDEFKISELTAGNGWWGNKFGLQLGVKYLNVAGIDHLDAQVEYNVVRPYTYSHRDTLENFPLTTSANYSHHNQPLAHPLGANFSELILKLAYRPSSKWHIDTRLVTAKYGQDKNGVNYGGNILLPSHLRLAEYGNSIGQGVATRLWLIGVDMSYQLYHNYYLDINMMYRKADADIDVLDTSTKYFGGGFRMNISNFNWDY